MSIAPKYKSLRDIFNTQALVPKKTLHDFSSKLLQIGKRIYAATISTKILPSILILDTGYEFTDLELKRLNKQFNTIKTIKFNTDDSERTLNNIKNIMHKNHFDIILLNTEQNLDDNIINYITNLQVTTNIKVSVIEDFVEKYLHKCFLPKDHTDMHMLTHINPYTKLQYFQKRVIDYIGVFSLLFLVWPILLYSRNRIKKDSPGTSMFKQNRVGINGKDFQCLKFRSMHINSHNDLYTRKNDSRIFSWGKTMRKTRIDELPQLLNVLKGDMHLIGPRAEWNKLVHTYEHEIPYYNQRHIVKPGITGWAQVYYPYGQNLEDTKQKLMYDFYYIKNWSMLLEIQVLWKTILVVAGKKGL